MTTTSLETSAPPPLSNRWVLTTDILIYFAICIAAYVVGDRTVVWVMGLFVSIVGFVLWMVARHQLGNSFMIGASAAGLVTHGLYRRFRHPIYLFGGIAHFGAFVALQHWWLAVVWLLYSTAIQWTRIRNEDAALEAKFGDVFRKHRQGTWV